MLPGRLSSEYRDLPAHRGRSGVNLQPESRFHLGRVKEDVFLRQPIETRSLSEPDGNLLPALPSRRLIPFGSRRGCDDRTAVSLELNLKGQFIAACDTARRVNNDRMTDLRTLRIERLLHSQRTRMAPFRQDRTHLPMREPKAKLRGPSLVSLWLYDGHKIC